MERETDPLLFFLLQFSLCYVVGVHGHIQAHTYELGSLTCLMIMKMMKKNYYDDACCLTHVLIYSSYMSAHLGREGRRDEAAPARTTEDLFGSTSESDTSTFHGFDEDDAEEPLLSRGGGCGGRSPSADKKGGC